MPPETNSDSKILFYLSLIFLFVVVALTVLLASGILQFGLLGPFIFVIYIVAGLLVSVACFGILTSAGEITGSHTPYGIHWRLGGAIVGFVVVAVGGGLYEKFVRTDLSLEFQILFLEEGSQNLAPVTGELRFVFGTKTEPFRLDGSGNSEIRNLPPHWKNKEVRFFIQSDKWRFAEGQTTIITLGTKDAFEVAVTRKPAFISYDNSELSIVVERGSTETFITGELIFNIRLIATNQSERPLPLRQTARVMMTKNGLEIRRLDVEATDGRMADYILLQPDEPTRIFVEGMLPNDWEFLLDREPDSYVVLFYNDPGRLEAGDYHSNFFTLGRDFLEVPDD